MKAYNPAASTLNAKDQIAMAALAAIITRGDYPSREYAAQAAYNFADAMLEERAKRQREQISGRKVSQPGN